MDRAGKKGITKCDGRGFREALEASAVWLETNVEVINALNHFPVPDKDTGTHLLEALRGAIEGMAETSSESVSAVTKAAAEGAQKRAEGHAGVILSLLLGGLAEGLVDKEAFTASELAAAMMEASAAAYEGIPQPLEGTILTVARDVAEAARAAAEEGGDIDYILEKARDEAKASVARTPSLLPALEEAGVVDAGGQGLYVILQGALRFLRGERITPPEKIESELPLRERGEGKPILECDGQIFRRLLEAGTIWLEKHSAVINSLNVYPVPDGDTGTNMLLTMRAALEEIARSPDHSIGTIAQAVSYGALMGARGNSGVILSQLLRGIAGSLDGEESMNAAQFAEAMMEASVTAYRGVIKPVEGTILTVAREVAEAVKAAAAESEDLRYILQLAVHEARASVARTPALLPVLKQAGVVDAGGQGLFIILEGFLRYIQGETLEVDSALNAAVDLRPPAEEEYGYDVQFMLQGKNLDLDQIRADIIGMGESVLVVGDGTTIKVHIHTLEPGTPLNYAVRLGSLSKITVENMQEQYQEFILSTAPAEITPYAKPPLKTEEIGHIATVVVAPGAGLRRVFESLGANAVVSGGQTMNPSTQELLKAIEGLAVDEIIVLPNNANIILAAQQAQELSTKKVRVVPTKTIPQGISALLAFNYEADLETNARLMEQSTAHIQTAEITTAVRCAQVNGLQVKEGEIIGLLNGTLTASGSALSDVAQEMLRQMEAEDCEIVTLFYGENVEPAEAESLAEDIRQRYPNLEVELIDGGQPHYHYIISAE